MCSTVVEDAPVVLLASLEAAARKLATQPVPVSGMAALEQAERLLRIGDLVRFAAERSVAVADQSGAVQASGYASTAAWLRTDGRMTGHAAAGLRRNAREFRRLTATADAVAAGMISHQMASVITAACAVLSDDEQARTAERILLNLARDSHATVEKVARAGRYLRQVLDPDGHLGDDERAWRDRYMTAHLGSDGSMTGSYRLPPEAAARLQALFDKYARNRAAGDTRTQSQRNADVLIQLLTQAVTAELLVVINAETLPRDRDSTPDGAAVTPDDAVTPDEAVTPDDDADAADGPTPGGDAGMPDAAVTPDDDAEYVSAADDAGAGDGVGTPAAESGADSPCDDSCPVCGRATNYDIPGLLLPTGHPLPAPHARRLARTSALYRMIVAANGKVLDLGSATRLVPSWMRRAILATYDTCAYDTCPIPAKWAEMDHVHPWSDHHQTRLSEIAPARDYHNRDRASHPTKYYARRQANGRWHLTSEP